MYLLFSTTYLRFWNDFYFEVVLKYLKWLQNISWFFIKCCGVQVAKRLKTFVSVEFLDPSQGF